VYVTHDQVEALTMGDRIVVMHQGRIQQVGTPAELYDNPVNRFVAGFIGTPAMGFIECSVERTGNEVALRAGDARVGLAPQRAQAVDRASTVVVGVRSERLSLVDDASAHADTLTVRGVVQVVEMLGSEQYVHVEVPAGMLTARVTRDRPVKPEEIVTLRAAARHLHLFDAATGAALTAPVRGEI